MLILTNTLADPYAKHIKLQKAVIEACAACMVHKEVVEEGAAPGRQRAQQMTHREEPRRPATAAPRQQAWQHYHHVHQRHTCGQTIRYIAEILVLVEVSLMDHITVSLENSLIYLINLSEALIPSSFYVFLVKRSTRNISKP